MDWVMCHSGEADEEVYHGGAEEPSIAVLGRLRTHALGNALRSPLPILALFRLSARRWCGAFGVAAIANQQGWAERPGASQRARAVTCGARAATHFGWAVMPRSVQCSRPARH